MTGLTAADFELLDDGKRQTITSVDVIDLSRPPRPDPAAPSAEPIPPSARRLWLLVFDLSYASASGLVRARDGAREFVAKSMKPTDLAAVGTLSVDTGWKLLVNFTRDRSQLAAALDTLGLPSLIHPSPDPLVFAFSDPRSAEAGRVAQPQQRKPGGVGVPGRHARDADAAAQVQRRAPPRARGQAGVHAGRDRTRPRLGPRAQARAVLLGGLRVAAPQRQLAGAGARRLHPGPLGPGLQHRDGRRGRLSERRDLEDRQRRPVRELRLARSALRRPGAVHAIRLGRGRGGHRRPSRRQRSLAQERRRQRNAVHDGGRHRRRLRAQRQPARRRAREGRGTHLAGLPPGLQPEGAVQARSLPRAQGQREGLRREGRRAQRLLRAASLPEPDASRAGPVGRRSRHGRARRLARSRPT